MKKKMKKAKKLAKSMKAKVGRKPKPPGFWAEPAKPTVKFMYGTRSKGAAADNTQPTQPTQESKDPFVDPRDDEDYQEESSINS